MRGSGTVIPFLVVLVLAEAAPDTTWSARQEKLLQKQARLRQEQLQLEEQHKELLKQQKADKLRQADLRVALEKTCYHVQVKSSVHPYKSSVKLPHPHTPWYIAPYCSYAINVSEPRLLVEAAAYEIDIAIPGLRQEDLSVSVEGGALHFEGQTTTSDFDVAIARAVRLPTDADLASGINTTHADGIIKTRVARRATDDLATTDLGSGRREFRSGATGVGWSTWLLHPRPLRQFDEEDSLANIVNKVEQAGGYKIFIPSPGNRTNPTYRIDEAQDMHYYTEYTDTPAGPAFGTPAFGNRDTNRFVPPPRELQDGVVTFPGYGILGVDSGRQFKPPWNIELYGADWTSANVRMTQKDGFIIVFIPLAPAGRSSRRDAPSTGVQATDDRSRYIKIDADAHAQKDDDDSYSYD